MPTKQEALNETSGRLQALFVATEVDIFHQTSGHFQDVLAAAEPDILKQISRHLLAVFLRTKLDMFDETSGQFSGTQVEVNLHMNVVKLKLKVSDSRNTCNYSVSPINFNLGCLKSDFTHSGVPRRGFKHDAAHERQ